MCYIRRWIQEQTDIDQKLESKKKENNDATNANKLEKVEIK